MASQNRDQKPETYDPRAALDCIPTCYLEAGISLSIEVVARRKGVSTLQVLREVAQRLNVPLQSADLEGVISPHPEQ